MGFQLETAMAQFTPKYCATQPSIELIIDHNHVLMQSTDYFAKLLGRNSHEDIIDRKSTDIHEPSIETSGSEFRRQDTKALRTNTIIQVLDIHTYQGGIQTLYTRKIPLIKDSNRPKTLLVKCNEIENVDVISQKVLNNMSHYLNTKSPISITLEIIDRYEMLGLTERQSACYYYMLRGYSDTEIAERLYISNRTVESHIANMKLVFQVNKRRDLIELGVNMKLLYYIPRSIIRHL
jgi:DNA-binding CsgD family transcriptional regulator